MSDNLVPYHYCEWPSGRYILKEMTCEKAARAAVEIAASLGEPTSNKIFWGKPGDSEAGFHRKSPLYSQDKAPGVWLPLMFAGCALFWVAVIWLYFHGIPLWLR